MYVCAVYLGGTVSSGVYCVFGWNSIVRCVLCVWVEQYRQVCAVCCRSTDLIMINLFASCLDVG